MSTAICIITGSTLGSAEYVAEHLETLLQQQGFSTNLQHGASYADVIEQPLWLVVTSTHGAGELPDNLKPLFEAIEHQQPDLSQLRFAVVGLGNSDYDTFCYAVNTVEHVLSERGAKAICTSLKIDVATQFDHDQCAEDWLPQFVQAI